MSTLFRIGPEGLLLIWGLIVSVLVAVLAWRRVSLTTAGITTLVVAVALVVWQFVVIDRRSVGIELMAASFILVPAALLLGDSRVNWLARHAWVLVLLGPIVFVGCYVGICELCYGSSARRKSRAAASFPPASDCGPACNHAIVHLVYHVGLTALLRRGMR